MKHSSYFLQFKIISFFVAILFLNTCSLFSKIESKKVDLDFVENQVIIEETTINKDSISENTQELEANIKDYIIEAAIMANIKSFHSLTSSIICEIVLYVIPNQIEKDIPIDFLITNDTYTELYFDTTFFLNIDFEGVIYNYERNFYEINLGRKKIGKNFIAKVELPHLSENNYINVLPNQFETIFMNR